MSGHDHAFDPMTFYCTRCGAGMMDVVNTGRRCVEDDGKVVAISHTLAKRRLIKLAYGVFQ
jgi:hypothetical protein